MNEVDPQDLRGRFCAISCVVRRYGMGLAAVLASTFSSIGIEAQLVPFEEMEPSSIDNAIVQVTKRGIRSIMCITFDDDAPYIVEQAAEAGLLGVGFHWLFTDSVGLPVPSTLHACAAFASLHARS